MVELKPCPFCGAPMNYVNRTELWAWHDSKCFFTLLEPVELDMTQEEIDEAFIEAWNRRAG